jgi:N-acetylglucosamine transport system permease protein
MYHGRRRFIAVFTIPPLALYVIFVLSPYAQAFYLSLTDWRGYSSQAKFVGFDNFRKLFDDDAFWAALKNNAVMLVVIPAVTVALALLLAGLLNFGGRQRGAGLSPVRGASLYRILFFFPQLLSVSIVGVLFQFVYTENGGLLNGALKAVGLGSLTQDWMGDSHIALFSVMAVIIWSGMGFYVVLFNAAMQSIPAELLEAAALDGAGKFSAFFRITLPLMWERVQVALVALGIVALDGFAFVQIMTGEPPGGPDNSTTVLGVPLYENAFQYGRFGYATAFGVALFFLTMTMAVLTFRFSRRDCVEY